MSRRVLILGGHGFMGSWLTQSLRTAGAVVIAPTRAEADMSSSSALKQVVEQAHPDTVINLAGISSVAHDNLEHLYDVNTLGHLRLLQAVSDVAPSVRVFLASTANLYGEGAEGRAFRETDAPAPRNHYANSKWGAEQLHRLFSELETCAVRPFNCTGRGQGAKFFIPKVVRAFRKRDAEIELGDIAIRRDIVDIRDVCAMWEALLAAPKPPAVVNFGNGEAVAFSGVIETLERLSGHSLRILRSEQFLRTADIAYQCADTAIIAGLGYRRKYAINETLAWMLAEENVP
ncbi:MAG: GDP-mannose 4,6-dehydratase [Alphaproteobacteria bacterium]|nr:GDP-mannose 4,6-dehydratase [Alphaproteobacteria bacterium]